jgi:hypothetical protein
VRLRVCLPACPCDLRSQQGVVKHREDQDELLRRRKRNVQRTPRGAMVGGLGRYLCFLFGRLLVGGMARIDQHVQRHVAQPAQRSRQRVFRGALIRDQRIEREARSRVLRACCTCLPAVKASLRSFRLRLRYTGVVWGTQGTRWTLAQNRAGP